MYENSIYFFNENVYNFTIFLVFIYLKELHRRRHACRARVERKRGRGRGEQKEELREGGEDREGKRKICLCVLSTYDCNSQDWIRLKPGVRSLFQVPTRVEGAQAIGSCSAALHRESGHKPDSQDTRQHP